MGVNNYLEESTAGECWLVKCPVCEHDGQSRGTYDVGYPPNEEIYKSYQEPQPLTDEELRAMEPDNSYYEEYDKHQVFLP